VYAVVETLAYTHHTNKPIEGHFRGEESLFSPFRQQLLRAANVQK